MVRSEHLEHCDTALYKYLVSYYFLENALTVARNSV